MYLLQKIFPKGEHGGGLSVTRPIHQFGSIPLSSRVFTKDKSHPTPLVLWNEWLEYHIAQMINRYHGWTLYIDFTKASRQTCEFSVKDRSLFAVYNRKGNGGCLARSLFFGSRKDIYIIERKYEHLRNLYSFFYRISFELSLFFSSRLLPSRAFRARSRSNSFLTDVTTVRKFRGNRISRSQEVSAIKQTRLSKLHEITRQRSRTRHLSRNEPSGSFGKLSLYFSPNF